MHENNSHLHPRRRASSLYKENIKPTLTLISTKTALFSGYPTSAPVYAILAERDGFDPLAILSVPDTDDQPTQTSPDASPTSLSLQFSFLTSSKTRHGSVMATSNSSTVTDSTTQSMVTSTPELSAGISSSAQAMSSQSASLATNNASSSQIANNASDPDKAALSEWKVIGIAVIAVTAVAVVILGSLFFDQWWTNFLRPIIWKGRRHPSAIEEFMPDWSTRTWRYDIKEKSDQHASKASFSSLSQSAKPQEPHGFLSVSPFIPRINATMDAHTGRWSYILDSAQIQIPEPTLPASTAYDNFRTSRLGTEQMTASTIHAKERTPELMNDDAYGGVLL